MEPDDLASNLEFWSGRARNANAGEDPRRRRPLPRRRSWPRPSLRRRGPSPNGRARPVAAAGLLAALTAAWLMVGHSSHSPVVLDADPDAAALAAPVARARALVLVRAAVDDDHGAPDPGLSRARGRPARGALRRRRGRPRRAAGCTGAGHCRVRARDRRPSGAGIRCARVRARGTRRAELVGGGVGSRRGRALPVPVRARPRRDVVDARRPARPRRRARRRSCRPVLVVARSPRGVRA